MELFFYAILLLVLTAKLCSADEGKVNVGKSEKFLLVKNLVFLE